LDDHRRRPACSHAMSVNVRHDREQPFYVEGSLFIPENILSLSWELGSVIPQTHWSPRGRCLCKLKLFRSEYARLYGMMLVYSSFLIFCKLVVCKTNWDPWHADPQILHPTGVAARRGQENARRGPKVQRGPNFKFNFGPCSASDHT